MPPPLPYSLSPHICVLPSPDLEQLLTQSSLPPIHHLLQSFSPLPQSKYHHSLFLQRQILTISQIVTTRTTTLTTVPHANFTLRFSDLREVESACKEDEEQRAGRSIDWISSRLGKNSSRWVSHVENLERDSQTETREPWWDELRRCVEGDHVPSRAEGWNHPVAGTSPPLHPIKSRVFKLVSLEVVYAVSTNAPNPLQAATELHTRQIDFPSWVDPTHVRYTLIVHPEESQLNEDE